MNISERLTKWFTDSSPTAVLRVDGKNATEPVHLSGWVVRDGEAKGSAVFGPYPETVHASGVRISVDEAFDDIGFVSTLSLPAGQTYRYTLTVGVS